MVTEEKSVTNVALVLEGGGFRGIYTAGVLDAFLHHQLYFSYVIGVSAGAAYGVSYISRQVERNLAVNEYINDPRYCGWRHLCKLGSYFNWDFVYHTMPTSLVPFDYATYYRSSSRLHVVLTNIKDGRPQYKELQTEDPLVFRDWLTATSSLPFISKPKVIDGMVFMDGGLSDSIPFPKAMADGNQRIVVVLTREKGYRKKPLKNRWWMRYFYRTYPHLVKCMLDRAQMYNQSVEALEQLERDGIAFIIRPDAALPVSRLENDPQKLRMVYDRAMQQMESVIPRLQGWLER